MFWAISVKAGCVMQNKVNPMNQILDYLKMNGLKEAKDNKAKYAIMLFYMTLNIKINIFTLHLYK